MLAGINVPPSFCLCRQQLTAQQQEAESAAISTTYPLMRAARLLESWATELGELEAHHTDCQHSSNSPSKKQRPWPSFDPSKPVASKKQQQQPGAVHVGKQGHDVGHALQKPLDQWSPEQRAAAATAATAWVAELSRGQQLLACALQRAEQAEMELAAVRLGAAGGSSSRGGSGKGGRHAGLQLLIEGSSTGKDGSVALIRSCWLLKQHTICMQGSISTSVQGVWPLV